MGSKRSFSLLTHPSGLPIPRSLTLHQRIPQLPAHLLGKRLQPVHNVFVCVHHICLFPDIVLQIIQFCLFQRPTLVLRRLPIPSSRFSSQRTIRVRQLHLPPPIRAHHRL